MSHDSSILRTQVQQFLQFRPSIHGRFPSELKASLLDHARSQRSRGISLEQIAADVGLSFNTLRGWMYAKSMKSRLKPVVVISPTKPHSDIVLITRQGHRVEGLGIDGLVELLSSLA